MEWNSYALGSEMNDLNTNERYLKFSVKIWITESEIRYLAQRRKARQVQRNRKIFIFALLASWRDKLSWPGWILNYGIGKEIPRAKDAKFGVDRKMFFFACFASWRENLFLTLSYSHPTWEFHLSLRFFQRAFFYWCLFPFLSPHQIRDGVPAIKFPSIVLQKRK